MFNPRSASLNRFVSGGAIRAAALLAAAGLSRVAFAQESSPPAILQDFESTWQTITNRTPDIFAAGYGGVYTPPPGRAESGNQSVGYDVYDRYDLGSPGNPTLYGTANGLKQMVSTIHTMGGSSYIDLVWNQSGFADTGTSGFAQAGGYPGFAMTLQTSDPTQPGYNTQGYNVTDGDYHSVYASGDWDTRVAGLIDIAQESNNVFIRQPTVAGSDNIPGPTPGASAWFYTGLANVPNPTNAQFYPQPGYNTQTYYDSDLNQSFTRSSFNTSSPMSGVPVAENAMGYLERYAQYMVQVIGADGFRIDAEKNMPQFAMDYLDVATYDSSNRYLLNGQKQQIFSFGEVYDSSGSLNNSYVNKSIYSGGIGNRDVEDYPLYFAMANNLTGYTNDNNWYNVVNASIDCYDPSNGTQDLTPSGSTGVKFVSNQDVDSISLNSVAYAYILMMPGNAMVYYNGHNFGTESQRNFPNDGREDALGGAYGNGLTTLLDLRNRYGRGNYRQDWLETNNYAFERAGSSLTMLSNNTQAGFDSRTIDVTFAPGTPLVELTGNAHGSVADPHGDIPQLLIVNSDSSSPTGASVNARFLHNSTYNLQGNSTYTGLGYLIYGIPTPTGSLSLTNVASTFGGTTPNSSDSNISYENGTDLVSNIDVVKTGSFQVTLNTVAANLLGYYRYQPADGDNAIIKVDSGTDINGTGQLFTDPSNTVTYGFEQFTTVNSPGYFANNGTGGNGTYTQTISSSQLGQGYHYITVEAFTHRTDGGPAIYTDWKQTVYVDLAPPNSAPSSLASTGFQTWTGTVTSVDGLANSVHTFLDLPAGLSNSQILSQISASNQATQEDTNLWQSTYSNLNSGNHTMTVVSYKPDGTYNIQRFSENQYSYLGVSNGNGSGLGDLNANGTVDQYDIAQLITVVESNNTQFNPAADVNGDGNIDLADVFLMGPVLSTKSVSSATWTAYNNYILGVTDNYVATHTYNVVGTNTIYQDTAGTTNASAGSTLTATYVRGTNLNIAAGADVQIASNPTWGNGASKISGLSISGSSGAWTGKLDLTNNSIVVESTRANALAEFAQLTNMVQQAYDGGQWDGEGVGSSAAAADPSHLTALGIMLNKNVYGNPIYNTFGGQSADASAILIRYTYYGDANLSGFVDSADYTAIDAGYLQKLSGWSNGDFNYDGVVNGSDYTLIDNAFNTQGSALPSPAVELTNELAAPTAQVAGSAAVPEPTGLALLAVTACGLLGRREVGGAAKALKVIS